MNDDVRFSKVMRLRFVQFLRGKALVKLLCVLAVAMAGILHVDAGFASAPADCAVDAASQDDDHGADQVGSERCHFCSVAAFASVATPVPRKPGGPAVPPGRSRQLIAFELPATAPPPRS